MVIFDSVYRIKEIRTNIFGAIVNNYSEGTCDYDFSCEMLDKFKSKADLLADDVDDGNNFKADTQLVYEEHIKYLNEIKEKKSN